MTMYLCIDLGYSTAGSLRDSIIKYLQNMLDGFSGDIDISAGTLAAEHPFKARDATEAEYLCKECTQKSHCVPRSCYF